MTDIDYPLLISGVTVVFAVWYLGRESIATLPRKYQALVYLGLNILWVLPAYNRIPSNTRSNLATTARPQHDDT